MEKRAEERHDKIESMTSSEARAKYTSNPCDKPDRESTEITATETLN